MSSTPPRRNDSSLQGGLTSSRLRSRPGAGRCGQWRPPGGTAAGACPTRPPAVPQGRASALKRHSQARSAQATAGTPQSQPVHRNTRPHHRHARDPQAKDLLCGTRCSLLAEDGTAACGRRKRIRTAIFFRRGSFFCVMAPRLKCWCSDAGLLGPALRAGLGAGLGADLGLGAAIARCRHRYQNAISTGHPEATATAQRAVHRSKQQQCWSCCCRALLSE